MINKLYQKKELTILTALLIFVLFSTIFLAIKSISAGNYLPGFTVLLMDTIFISGTWPVYKLYIKSVEGAHGKEDVSLVLKRLEKEGFHYLEGVEIEASLAFDLVAFGPTGIWIIWIKERKEAEIVRDNVLEEEINKAFKGKIGLENFLKKEGLPFPVTPVLVFAGKNIHVNFKLEPINGVYVTGRRRLEELLLKHPNRYLSRGQIYDINEVFKKVAD